MKLKNLSVRILLRMSIRITLIIVAVTVAGYFHLVKTIENETKLSLSRYISEREAREGIIFSDAVDNHKLMIREFVRIYRDSLKDKDTPELYQHLTRRFADGAVRNRNEKFDGREMSDRHRFMTAMFFWVPFIMT